ncbi:uncharacterized protein LOC142346152 [Convolutriloba macropyga]|uniref:uncharacterized protein LOC142346152 n=1 Tax=Convolutriloba macropyga TaxID=536237 RepID=UPI003F520FD4
MLIFAHKQPKKIGEIPIILLACVDGLMCVFSIVFTGFIAIWQPNIRDIGCYKSLCIVGNVAFDIPYTYSCGMMSLMSYSRFLAACKPHDYAERFNFKRQRSYYIGLLLVAIPSCGLQIRSCATAPDNCLIKFIWVVQRSILVAITIGCMVYCYSNIVNTLRAAKVKRKGDSTSEQLKRRESNVQYIRARRQTLMDERTNMKVFSPGSCPSSAKPSTQLPLDKPFDAAGQPEQLGSSQLARENKPDGAADYVGNDNDRVDIDYGIDIFVDEYEESKCERDISDEPVRANNSQLLIEPRFLDDERSLSPSCCTIMTEYSFPSSVDQSGDFDETTARKQLQLRNGTQLSLQQSLSQQNESHTASALRVSHLLKKVQSWDHEKRMAGCFFLIGSAFLFLTIPDLILHLADTIVDDETNDAWVGNFVWMQTLTQTLFCINFSINPLIYYHMNGFFRTQVRSLFAINSITSFRGGS